MKPVFFRDTNDRVPWWDKPNAVDEKESCLCIVDADSFPNENFEMLGLDKQKVLLYKQHEQNKLQFEFFLSYSAESKPKSWVQSKTDWNGVLKEIPRCHFRESAIFMCNGGIPNHVGLDPYGRYVGSQSILSQILYFYEFAHVQPAKPHLWGKVRWEQIHKYGNYCTDEFSYLF